VVGDGTLLGGGKIVCTTTPKSTWRTIPYLVQREQ